MSNVKSKSAQSSIHTKTVDIDVAWALKRLEEAKGNVNNRYVSDRHVNFLTREITEGRWQENGVPIILDEDNLLIDGQHRLWAVVQSQQTIRCQVTYGVNRETAMPTIDTDGRKRSLGDTLIMDSPIDRPIANPNVIQAVVKWLHRYRHHSIFMGASRVSTGELRTLLQKEPGLVDSCKAGESLKGLMPSTSLSVFAHYVFSTRNPEKADQFFNQLSSGAQLMANSPVLALREKLIEYQVKKERRTMEHICFVMFRAWLYFEAGLPLARLLWRRQASEKRPPEPFPYLDDYPMEPGKLKKELQKRSHRVEKTKH